VWRAFEQSPCPLGERGLARVARDFALCALWRRADARDRERMRAHLPGARADER
jgi:hypothetical protein